MTQYWTSQRLLDHLPLIYRQRDEEIATAQGLDEGPLASLMAVWAEEIGTLEANLDELYRNWFVETAEPWALPYIGDLLRIRVLPQASRHAYTPRAYVANMLGYRRRKGTPGMLEELGSDATGWHARVVESFRLLARTQHLNRLRPNEWLVPDLRDLDAMERLASPLTSTHRLVDVRRISSSRTVGTFNIPNVAINLWPLRIHAPPDATADAPAVTPPARFASEARPTSVPGPGGHIAHWFLHPLGVDCPLFNRPLSDDPPLDDLRAAERYCPVPLRRLALHRELEDLRQAIVDGEDPSGVRYLGSERPVLQLFVNDEPEPIPAEQICIADLSQAFASPPMARVYERTSDSASVAMTIRVAIDPATGRVAFRDDEGPEQLRAVFAHAFSADLGGGPYDRRDSIETTLDDTPTWQLGVSRLAPDSPDVVATLAEAIDQWNAQPAGTRGLICVMDSMRYEEDLSADQTIEIPAGSRLYIVAADWPEVETEPGIFERQVGDLSADRLRPHLLGALRVEGTAAADSENPGVLVVDGLLIEGEVSVAPGNLGGLYLGHCTLPPGAPLSVESATDAENASLGLRISDSRVASVSAVAPLRALEVADALLGDPASPSTPAITVPGTGVSLARCTVWGPSSMRELEASDTIFDASVIAERKQVGCVRYSYVGAGSETPRRFRCQPDLALDGLETADQPATRARVRPMFESLDPHHPAYARLARACATEIRRGGEDRREMGVFAGLDAPLRLDFLAANLNEFLRAGLDAAARVAETPAALSYGNS